MQTRTPRPRLHPSCVWLNCLPQLLAVISKVFYSDGVLITEADYEVCRCLTELQGRGFPGLSRGNSEGECGFNLWRVKWEFTHGTAGQILQYPRKMAIS